MKHNKLTAYAVLLSYLLSPLHAFANDSAKKSVPLSKTQLLDELNAKEKTFDSFYQKELEWLQKVINPLVTELVKINKKLNTLNAEIKKWDGLEVLAEKRPVEIRFKAERYLKEIQDDYLYLYVAKLNFTQLKDKHLDEMGDLIAAIGATEGLYQEVKSRLMLVVAVFEKGDFEALAQTAFEEKSEELKNLEVKRHEFLKSQLSSSLKRIDYLLEEAQKSQSRALWLSAYNRTRQLLANKKLSSLDPVKIEQQLKNVIAQEISIEVSKRKILADYLSLDINKLAKKEGGDEIISFFDHFLLDPAPSQYTFYTAENFLALADKYLSASIRNQKKTFFVPIIYKSDFDSGAKPEKGDSSKKKVTVEGRVKNSRDVSPNGKVIEKITVERYRTEWSGQDYTRTETSTTVDGDSDAAKDIRREFGLERGSSYNRDFSGGPDPHSMDGSDGGNAGPGNGNGPNGNSRGNGNNPSGSGNNNAGNSSHGPESGNGDGNGGSGANGNNANGNNANGGAHGNANGEGNNEGKANGNGNKNSSKQANGKSPGKPNATKEAPADAANSENAQANDGVNSYSRSGEFTGGIEPQDNPEALPSPTNQDRIRTKVHQSETKTEKIREVSISEPITPSDIKDQRSNIYKGDKARIERADNHNAAKDFSSKVHDPELSQKAKDVADKIKSGERALKANFEGLMNHLREQVKSNTSINMPESTKGAYTDAKDVKAAISETRIVIMDLRAKLNSWASPTEAAQINNGLNAAEALLSASENALAQNDISTATALFESALDILSAYGPMALRIGVGLTPAGDVVDLVELATGIDVMTGESIGVAGQVAAALGLLIGNRALWTNASNYVGDTIGGLLKSSGVDNIVEGITSVKNYDALNMGPMSSLKIGEPSVKAASTFRSGKYKMVTRGKPTKVYRAIGPNNKPFSNFWTPDKPSGPVASIIDNAIPGARNPSTRVLEAEIPAGEAFAIGITGPQGHLPGGKVQIVIENPNKLEKIKEVTP